MNIQRKMNELVKEVRKHNFLYHTLDTPEITDDQFDELFSELKELEISYPKYKVENSPTDMVGGIVLSTLTKMTRAHKMYSLDKVNNLQQVDEFFKMVDMFTCGQPRIWVDTKLDGLAIELLYQHGKLVLATTRGDGTTGEVVTDNVRCINGIPATLNIDNPPESIRIRGEIVMHKHDFTVLNQQLATAGQKEFANPRNAAAGTVRQLVPSIDRLKTLYFYAYGLGSNNEKDIIYRSSSIDTTTHSGMLKTYTNMGISTPPLSRLCTTLEEVREAITTIGHKKNSLPMECDGAVLIVDDRTLYHEFGHTSKYPKYALAYKYPAEVTSTKLLSVMPQIGRTGVITPVAILEPVSILGVTITRATLHNWDEVHRLDLHEGDVVNLVRSNDVIPKVLSVSEHHNGIKIIPPVVCPNCSTTLIRVQDQVKLICPNPNCIAKKVNSIMYFASKPCANINGLGIETIKNLVKHQLISDAADLYKLTTNDLTAIGMGEIESINLIDAIQKSKSMDLASFVQSLGIPNVGNYVAGILASKFDDITSLLETVLDEHEWADTVTYCQDIGKITARSIEDFFSDLSNLDLLNKFEKYGICPKSKSPIIGKLSGTTIAVTGTLSMSRGEFKKLIELHGGILSNSVTKNTDYLVVGEDPGKSKLKQAKLISGVVIITEQELINKVAS